MLAAFFLLLADRKSGFPIFLSIDKSQYPPTALLHTT